MRHRLYLLTHSPFIRDVRKHGPITVLGISSLVPFSYAVAQCFMGGAA